MNSISRDGGDAERAPAPIVIEDAEVSISDIKLIDLPGLVAFWVLAIIVFLQFFTRYVLNDSLAWTEEAARYLLVLVCFLGSVSALRRGSHIMLEFFIRTVPRPIGKAMAVIAELITLGFLGTLTLLGIELIHKTRQKMVTLPVPKAWIYAVCVVCLGVMTVYSAVWLWRKLRASPEEVVAALDRSTPTD